MKTNLSIKFNDKDELQSFLVKNADKVDLGSIQGQTLSSLDEDFVDVFKDELNLHKLFIQVIKNGDLTKVEFCLNNGVGYHDLFSSREAMLMSIMSKCPIDVAFDYGQDHIVSYFLEGGFLSTEEKQKLILRLINTFCVQGANADRLTSAIKLIERLINTYGLDPDYSGGIYINTAMMSRYDNVVEILEILMDKGANVNYLDLYYNRDHRYSISAIKYIANFMDNDIDIGFFTTGKFSDDK